MENYRTEEEQVEVLKRWWSENGRSILLAVALALGLGFGWQGWQRSRDASAEDAALRYQTLLEALDARRSAPQQAGIGDPRELAEDLLNRAGSSVYGQLAALHLARLAAQDDDLDSAERHLRWVVAEAGGELSRIAQLRLARVLAAQGKTDQALAQLATGDTALGAAYAVARGDVMLGAGRDAEALDAYREAAASLGPQGTPSSLRDKIDYLTPVPPSVADISEESDTPDASPDSPSDSPDRDAEAG